VGTENLNPHVLVTKTLPRVAAEMAKRLRAHPRGCHGCIQTRLARRV